MGPWAHTRNRSSLGVQPLPRIIEDEVLPPAAPEQQGRRPPTASGRLSRHASSQDAGAPPPGRGTEDMNNARRRLNAEGEGGKDGKWYAGRRGVYRLAVLAFVSVAVIVGLAVGLTLGLRKKNHSAKASQPPPSTLFPAGSYSFTTALTNVSTGCTTDPSLFRCAPFSTYSPSAPDNSSITFHWTITPLTSYSYAISSRPDPDPGSDPPVPSFTDLPLTLLDANQYSERLVFNLTTAKPVPQPAAPAVTCWFNSTVMTVTLWTRMRASYPANATELPAPPAPAPRASGGPNAPPWPYKAEVAQAQAHGPGVPDCRDSSGRRVNATGGGGGGGGLGTTGGGGGGGRGECECRYANYGLDDSGAGGGGNGTSGSPNGTVGLGGRLARWVV